MGFLYVLGPCYVCSRLFAFSATRVPSIVVEGEREPICGTCIDRANVERARTGLPPIEVLPGAFDPDEDDWP